MGLQILPNFRKPYKEILQEPDEGLRKVSKEVNKIDKTIFEVASQLVNVLKKIDRPYNPWLGMAAPQIGHNVRIIALKEKYRKYTVIINPEIVKQRFFLPSITSCYSLPGIYLRRHHFYFKVKYQDLDNKTHIRVYKGGKALVLQQEIDHINGILACD